MYVKITCYIDSVPSFLFLLLLSLLLLLLLLFHHYYCYYFIVIIIRILIIIIILIIVNVLSLSLLSYIYRKLGQFQKWQKNQRSPACSHSFKCWPQSLDHLFTGATMSGRSYRFPPSFFYSVTSTDTLLIGVSLNKNSYPGFSHWIWVVTVQLHVLKLYWVSGHIKEQETVDEE